MDLPSVFVGKDLFGAEPFDPFTCGSADFPPDIQSKLDEMQVSGSSVCFIFERNCREASEL